MNPEFKDEPILLMANTLEITNEGIEFLKSLKETKIAVVCISGPMFSGKSFIANLLLDRKVDGFEISAMEKVQSTCTKGLWVWGRPISVEDYHLLLIDSEGLFRSPDTIDYDKKIFTLCTLISSMLIYNSDQQLEANINEFSLVSESIQEIKLQENLKINNNYLPDLLWLVRDFEKEKESINVKFAELTKDKLIFNSLFNKVKCFSTPMPMSEDDMLIKLYQEDNEEFLPEFIIEFDKIKKYIFDNAQPKAINNILLNGKLLYGILQNYSESLNSTDYPVIMDTLECVLLSNANEVSEDILDKCRGKFIKQIENDEGMNIIDRYKAAFELLADDEIKAFCTSDIGKVLKCNFIEEALEKIVSLTKEFTETNYQQCLADYDKLIDQVINKMNTTTEKITTIDTVRPSLLTFVSYLKDQLDTIANYTPFNISKSYPLLIDSIQSKLLSITDSIDKAIEIAKEEAKALKEEINQMDIALSEKSKEMGGKENRILELQSEIERLSRENKTKDKENVNNIEIERNKYFMLEEHNKALLEEKDRAIKELEEKIDNLSKELADALKDNLTKTNDFRKTQLELEDLKVNDNQDKASIAELKKMNMKSIYKSIQTTLLEYKETVDLLEREKETVFRTKYIEYNSKEVDSKTKVWIDELRLFREQHSKLMAENYQKEVIKAKEENNSLRFELTKVNDALRIIEVDYHSLKGQYEELNMNMKETEVIKSKREQLIKDQSEVIQQNEGIIHNLNSDKEDLELELNKQIINQKIQSTDYNTIFQLFFTMAKKQKDKFDYYFFQLSKENRARAFHLNKDLSIFKLNEKDIEK